MTAWWLASQWKLKKNSVPIKLESSLSTSLLQLIVMEGGANNTTTTDDILRFVDNIDYFTVPPNNNNNNNNNTSTVDGKSCGYKTELNDNISTQTISRSSSQSSLSPSLYSTPTTSDIWPDIANALDLWSQRILDVEIHHRTRCATFNQKVTGALHRMHVDGVLNRYDIDEIKRVSGLWSQLLSASSCYTLGGGFAKRDIITLLLELYSLHQISRDLVVDTCLKL